MPVLLEGVPGVAKTQVIKQLGKKFSRYLAARNISDTFYTGTCVIPQAQPETIEGIPSQDMEYQALRRLPLIDIRNLIEAEYGIWAGDEVTSGNDQTGAAAMTLIQDGIAGDVQLPHTVGRVMMCNPPWCAAGDAREFTAPEINRVLKLEWKLSDEDFLDFLTGGPGAMAHVRFLPSDWEERFMPKMRILVKNFLSQNRNLINTMESGITTEHNYQEPWASQRQWLNLTRLLAAIESIGDTESSQMAYYAVLGTVGEAAAETFVGWLRDMNLPDPEDLLQVAVKYQEKINKLSEDSKAVEDYRKKAWGELREIIPDDVWNRSDKISTVLESVALAALQERESTEEQTNRWLAGILVIEPVLDKQVDTALPAAIKFTDRKPPNVKTDTPNCLAKIWRARQEAGVMAKRRKRAKRKNT